MGTHTIIQNPQISISPKVAKSKGGGILPLEELLLLTFHWSMPRQLMLFSLLARAIFIFVSATRGRKDAVASVGPRAEKFNIVPWAHAKVRSSCFGPEIRFWGKFGRKNQNCWCKLKFFRFGKFLSKKSIWHFDVT